MNSFMSSLLVVGVNKNRRRCDFALVYNFEMCFKYFLRQRMITCPLQPCFQITVLQMNCAGSDRLDIDTSFLFYNFQFWHNVYSLSDCSQCVHNLELFYSVMV